MKPPSPAQTASRLLETHWRPIYGLSPREFQVFLLLGDGLSSGEIANTPGFKCSRKTVEAHFANLRRKLDLPTIARARVYAATFIALHGKPEIERRVTERRLIFKAA